MSAAVDPLRVEILTYAPTAFFGCKNCEVPLVHTRVGRAVRHEQLGAGLPEEMLLEYARISDWCRQLLERHGERVALEVIDVASVRGFLTALRRRARRYPAFVVGGRPVPDLAAAEAAIAAALGERAGSQ